MGIEKNAEFSLRIMAQQFDYHYYLGQKRLYISYDLLFEFRGGSCWELVFRCSVFISTQTHIDILIRILKLER